MATGTIVYLYPSYHHLVLSVAVTMVTGMIVYLYPSYHHLVLYCTIAQMVAKKVRPFMMGMVARAVRGEKI